MKAAVVPKVGGKFQVTKILMPLIVTVGCVVIQHGKNLARKSDRVTWAGSRRPWTIAGMELEV